MTPLTIGVEASLARRDSRARADLSSIASEDPIELRRLLSNLSATLLKVPTEALTDEVAKALARIGRAVDADRCAIVELPDANYRPEPGQSPYRIQTEQDWISNPDKPAFTRLPNAPLDLVDAKLKQGRPAFLGPMAEIPKAWPSEREFARETGLKWLLALPLVMDGKSYALALFSFTKQRRWSDDSKEPLSMVAQVLANVVARRRHQKAQEEHARFETHLAAICSLFVHTPPGELDNVIEDALHRSCKHFGFDRAAVFQSGDDDTFQMTHRWDGESANGAPRNGVTTHELSPWTMDRLARGESILIQRTSELPPEAAKDKEYALENGILSSVRCSLNTGGSLSGYVAFHAIREEKQLNGEAARQVRIVTDILANALERKHSERDLQKAFSEIERLKDRLTRDNVVLRAEIGTHHRFQEIIGKSEALHKVLSRVQQVATTHATVLILGETGTGKELIAHAIHKASTRKNKSFITVNCAALPSSLIESELFGHERGAFTGATEKKIGRFELADRGTIFLDEIGDLDIELQTKLLRVLQENEFERVGSSRTQKVDIRVIAASNRNLEKAVEEGHFRADLFYRLNVFPIQMPPLRERRSDIPLLTWYFIEKSAKALGRKIEQVPAPLMDAFKNYKWPGNIRELQNIIERAVIVSPGPVLDVDDSFGTGATGLDQYIACATQASPMPHSRAQAPYGEQSLNGIERSHIIRVLEDCGWKITGKGNAAELLDLKPSTLRFRMNKLGIKRPLRGG